jgi:acetoin utilization deacetylase AcuC-like enzyme
MLNIAWHPVYVHPVPENHRFPMEKYELLPQRLIRLGIADETSFFEPNKGHKYDLSVHCSEYRKRLFDLNLTKKEERASGFKQSRSLVDRELRITNGTVEGATFAMQYGVAFNIAGGTHHAFTNRPEGFCLLNDQAVAASYLFEQTPVNKVLIVDLDVHQGNGTAQIFANDDRVFTFSMHGAKNYPAKKPKSDLDIPLEDGTGDAEYLELLKTHLSKLFDEVRPDFVFFLAGVDVLKEDKLGRLALSLDGCKQRDQLVFDACYQHEVPVMVTMGGGYAPDIRIILEAHCNTFAIARDIYT